MMNFGRVCLSQRCYLAKVVCVELMFSEYHGNQCLYVITSSYSDLAKISSSFDVEWSNL